MLALCRMTNFGGLHVSNGEPDAGEPVSNEDKHDDKKHKDSCPVLYVVVQLARDAAQSQQPYHFESTEDAAHILTHMCELTITTCPPLIFFSLFSHL